MGIEYIIVNLDKKELLDFDRLGFGTKLSNITGGTISSFLAWLLVNPEGCDDNPPKMLGRWAGDRIEIIGDEEIGSERQEKARKEYRDITVEAISGFAEVNPFERITRLQPMGLIDKSGNVVVDRKDRESVANYWKAVGEREEKNWARFLFEWSKIEETLRNGAPQEVRRLRCPVDGGPMRIEYIESTTGTPNVRVSGITSDLDQRVHRIPSRPVWVEVLGVSFVTEPQPGSRPNPG